MFRPPMQALFCQLILQFFPKPRGAAGIVRRDKNRIITRDGSRDFRPGYAVQSYTDGMGRAGMRPHDHKVTGVTNISDELLENSGQGRLRRRRGRPAGFRQAVSFPRLCQSQFFDVPRNGGLSYMYATPRELAPQLRLGPNGLRTDDFQNLCAAVDIVHGKLCTRFIKIHHP